MTIRLSGAQVTRIQEFLNRYRENTNYEYAFYGSLVPQHLATEVLVEDILKEVTPPIYLVKENGEICPITSTVPTPNEQQSVSI